MLRFLNKLKLGIPCDAPTRKLEVELSTKCTAECADCPRTRALSGENKESDWDVGFLDADAILNFLKDQSDIKEVHFCGGYGDAIYHPQLHEICSRIHNEIPYTQINIETNGSHRSVEWWKKLGTVLDPQLDCVTFSVDGLEDTNHLYRVGTKWPTILEGMTTIRESFSGMIRWKWIVFKHNQHQVTKGFLFSKKLKIDTFLLINSGRHYEGSEPTIPFTQLEESIARAKNQSAMFAP